MEDDALDTPESRAQTEQARIKLDAFKQKYSKHDRKEGGDGLS